MKKEELIAKGLTEEQATAVIDIYTNEMKGFIPKARFDEVNTAKADLEKQVADRDKQLKTLKDEAKDSEVLQAKITELEDANKATKKAYEDMISRSFMLWRRGYLAATAPPARYQPGPQIRPL